MTFFTKVCYVIASTKKLFQEKSKYLYTKIPLATE